MTKNLNLVFVEINTRSHKVIVGEVYRVPNTSEKESVSRYNTLIDGLNKENCEVIIGTDQNFNLLHADSHNHTNNLLNSFLSNGFVPTVTKPTQSLTHLLLN